MQPDLTGNQLRRMLRGQQRAGRERIILPTRPGYTDLGYASPLDEEQRGGTVLAASIANNSTGTLRLGLATAIGAAYISYWVRRGTRGEAGRLCVFLDGAGSWQISRTSHTVAGQDCGLTLGTSVSVGVLSLTVAADNSGDATTFNARWFYVPQ